METGNTILSISAGRFARSTVICSSSPSPPPVRLSPVCRTAPSGVARLLKKTKCLSDRAFPSTPSAIALASRSNSSPLVVRSSQPRPTVTALRPGASFVSETLPPLLRLTPIFPPRSPRIRPRHRGNSRCPPGVGKRMVSVTPRKLFSLFRVPPIDSGYHDQSPDPLGTLPGGECLTGSSPIPNQRVHRRRGGHGGSVALLSCLRRGFTPPDRAFWKKTLTPRRSMTRTGHGRSGGGRLPAHPVGPRGLEVLETRVHLARVVEEKRLARRHRVSRVLGEVAVDAPDPVRRLTPIEPDIEVETLAREFRRTAVERRRHLFQPHAEEEFVLVTGVQNPRRPQAECHPRGRDHA